MDTVLEIIQNLTLKHDKISPELVKAKCIKLGLRNEDGTGVFVGITSKGQVIGYRKEIHADGTEKKIDLDGELYYSGYNVKDLVRYHQKENRFGFEETVYLLLTSELPGKNHLRTFTRELSKGRPLPEEAKKII